MHKKFTFGLIALLGVSLFILGCDDSSDDAGPSDAEKAATTLAEALGAGAAVDGTDSTKVNVTVNPPSIDKSVPVGAGVKLDIAAGVDLTVGQGGTLVIDATAVISGTGVIKTSGDGTITIGDKAGYTADANGVAGDDIADAVTALAADSAIMEADDVALDDATFGTTSVTGLGSVTVAANNAAVAVTKDTDGGSDEAAITLTATTAFEGAAPTPSAVEGTANTITTTSITLVLNSGALELGDSAYNNTTAKACVVTFSGVKLKNNGLVAPALANFKIGLLTSRA
jgi:hypothetical protein